MEKIQTLISNLRFEFNEKLDELEYYIHSMPDTVSKETTVVHGDMVHFMYNESHYFGDVTWIDNFSMEISLLKPFTTIVDKNGECLYLWKLESGKQKFYMCDVHIITSVPALGERRYSAVCDLGFTVYNLDVNATDLGLEYYVDNIFFVRNE